MSARKKRPPAKTKEPPASATAVKFKAAPGLKAQYRAQLDLHPEIAKTIKTFNTRKRADPPVALPKRMSDHALKGKLAGIRECHLADDVLLLYTHRDALLKMIYICTHAELYSGDVITTVKESARLQ